jgi:hypothetical protein
MKLGCATEESVNFGDASCVAGGCLGGPGSSTTTSSSGGPCTVNDACTVSFRDDIFTPILDATGTANCATASANCHATGVGNLTIPEGDAAAAYAALTAYLLDDAPGPAGPYIVPCDPSASRWLCNMKGEAGANPFGTCGSTMPLIGGTVVPLTTTQLETIAEWITCGAPDN